MIDIMRRKNKRFWTLCIALLVWSLMVSFALSADGKPTTVSGSGNIMDADGNTVLSFNTTGTLQYSGDGTLNYTNSASTTTSNGNALTISAVSSTYTDDADSGSCGKQPAYAGTTTTVVTFKNPTTKAVKVTAITPAENTGSYTVNKTVPFTVAAGGTFQITVSATPTATASDPVTTTAVVTITAESMSYNDLTLVGTERGFTVSATIGPEEVSAIEVGAKGTTIREVPAGAKITLPTATAADNYVFYGWRLSDGRLLKDGAEFEMSGDLSVAPIYLPASEYKIENGEFLHKNTKGEWNKGPFTVGSDRYLFWQDAMAAGKSSGLTVILVEDYTLSATYAGNGLFMESEGYISGTDTLTYTVPTGVKFLVPYSDSDTTGAFTAKPTEQYSAMIVSSSTAISTYVTLTVPSGAHILNNGQINVNGQRISSSAPQSGTTRGGHGRIVLSGSETQLTVSPFSTLYCYGYISGTGMVEVLKDGAAHEYLQMCDWAGGGNSYSWYSKHWLDSNKQIYLFLLTRYFVQNIEAPLKVYADGTLYAESIVEVSDQKFANSSKLVGSLGGGGGFLLLGAGTQLLRTYDATTDRVCYKASCDEVGGSGTVELGSISVNFKYSIFDVDMSSADYTLPINNTLTIELDDGITGELSTRAAVLPGAKIIVHEGATLNVKNHLYLFDKSDWVDNMVFPGTASGLPCLPYTDGRGSTKKLSVTDSALLQVDGILDISSNGGIFSTNGYDLDNNSDNGVTSSSSSSLDKVVVGTGEIRHNGALSGGALKTGYDGSSEGNPFDNIQVAVAVGLLAGISENASDVNDSFGNGTYYSIQDSDGNTWWYQHQVNVVDVAGNVLESEYIVGHEYGLQLDKTSHHASTSNGTIEDGVVKNMTEQVVNITIGEHVYKTVTNEPTCVAEGYTTYTCDCGYSYVGDKVPATGKHSWVNSHICSGCGTEAGAVWYGANPASVVYYLDLASALTEETVGTNGYVQLLANSAAVTISKPVNIDLLGKNIASVTIENQSAVNIMDTRTDGFNSGEAGTIGGDLTALGVYSPAKAEGALYGKHYAAVPVYGTDGKTVVGTQFHRVAISVTAYRFYLVQGNAYLGVEGTFRGTLSGLNALDAMGFVFTGVDKDIAAKFENSEYPGSENASVVDVSVTNESLSKIKPGDKYENGDEIEEDKWTVTTRTSNDGIVSYLLPVHYSFAVAKGDYDYGFDVLSRMFFNSDYADSAVRTINLSEALATARSKYQEIAAFEPVEGGLTQDEIDYAERAVSAIDSYLASVTE